MDERNDGTGKKPFYENIVSKKKRAEGRRFGSGDRKGRADKSSEKGGSPDASRARGKRSRSSRRGPSRARASIARAKALLALAWAAMHRPRARDLAPIEAIAQDRATDARATIIAVRTAHAAATVTIAGHALNAATVTIAGRMLNAASIVTAVNTAAPVPDRPAREGFSPAARDHATSRPPRRSFTAPKEARFRFQEDSARDPRASRGFPRDRAVGHAAR